MCDCVFSVYHIIVVLTLHNSVCFFLRANNHTSLFNNCNARMSPFITFLSIGHELTLSFFLSYMVYVFVITSFLIVSSLTFFDFKHIVVFFWNHFLLLAAATTRFFTHTCWIPAPTLSPPTYHHLSKEFTQGVCNVPSDIPLTDDWT